jgi:hypothetical protein
MMRSETRRELFKERRPGIAFDVGVEVEVGVRVGNAVF